MKILHKFYAFIIGFFERYKTNKQLKQINEKLDQANLNKSAHQYILIKKIKDEINKLWPKSRSKYIPLSLPERRDIRAKIESKFGKEMIDYNVKLNDKLKLS